MSKNALKFQVSHRVTLSVRSLLFHTYFRIKIVDIAPPREEEMHVKCNKRMPLWPKYVRPQDSGSN